MEFKLTANRNTYYGLFFITLSVLMYEILLTRIFSVIAYYHFAFMAISIAMFGMTFGAMLVYLLPDYQHKEKTQTQMATATLLFSVSIVQSFLILLAIPLKFTLTFWGVLSTMMVYVLLAIPFIFSGICVCLVLTRFTGQINKLYATDLLGAGLGCIAVLMALNTFSAPTCVFIVAACVGLSAIFFSRNSVTSGVREVSVIFTLLICLMVAVNIDLEKFNMPIFRFTWVKNQYEEKPLYEKWNSFSRLRIVGDEKKLQTPFGWGLSDRYPSNPISRYIWLTIDSSAGTPLLNFRNNLAELDYLKYDVTNLANYLRPNSDTLIIGVGGGRDILSALVFHQHSVTGVEINKNILNILTNRFANYTGHLDKIPGVTLVNDEARSYISRLPNKFNIIQMSLIDTWAATAAGAFTLSENGLYTLQNWQMLLKHLSPHGILTVSRWYLPQQPAEMLRVAALASQSLKNLGVKDPTGHIMIFASPVEQFGAYASTLLVSPDVFSQSDIIYAQALAKKMNFDIIFTPLTPADSSFTRLISSKDMGPLLNSLDYDLSPPTDDKPFFFQMIKLRGIFNLKLWNTDGYFSLGSHAVVVIGVLLITVTVLTLLCILLPLMMTTQKGLLSGAGPLLCYFASIGFGFMLVEISQIQRLSLFLGHPTYGLSVVLFSLLLACGLGSLFSANRKNNSLLPLMVLLAMLIIFGGVSADIISNFQTSSTPVRILVSVLLLFPMGFFMGMALPLGMRFANHSARQLTPWLWGVNGATSICGSVFAIAFALMAGIAATFWIGVICYALAVSVFYFFTPKRGPDNIMAYAEQQL